MEDGIPAWRFITEKMSCRRKTPLAAALELVENGVDNLYKIKFGRKTSFCYRKIGHNFRFYCIFVEYSVFWHLYGILECGDYNIVRPLRNALYFYYFTVLLTSQNKFKQLHNLNQITTNMLNSKSIFTLILPIAILCSCSNEEELLSKSVVSEDDPISVVFKDYLNEHEGTRSSLEGVVITNVEQRHYMLTENGVEEIETRSESKSFDVIRADFFRNGQKGYALLSTDSGADGVYYYTENGVITDTVENKGLAMILDAIPTTVGATIGGIVSKDTLNTGNISSKGSGPLLQSKWGQGAPFYNMMPICYCKEHPNGRHSLVGCVNVAAGQVIAYCKKFTGTYYGTKDINFSQIVKLGNSFSGTKEDILQVSSFLREISMQIGSNYGCSGTSAYMKNLYNYLKDLGYTCSYSSDKINREKIKDCLFNFNKRIPVIVSGVNSKTNVGHAWVVDGVRILSDGYEFNNNWGWYGSSDGWVKGSVLGYVSQGRAYDSKMSAIYITNY